MTSANLPHNWSWVKLGDVIKVSSGKGLTSEKMLNNGKYPVYGGNGVTGFYNEFLFENSKLIIGRVGAKCGVVHITKPKSWVTDNALVVDLITDRAGVMFLYYCLSYHDLNKLSVSTAQPVISGAKIYSYEIMLPPIDQQLKVVDKIEELFSGLDNGVAFLKKAKEQIKLYKQSVLKAAFSGRLVKEIGRDRSSRLVEIPTDEVLKAAEPQAEYMQSHTELVSGSEKLKQVQLDSSGLPEGWKLVKLEEVMDSLQYGTSDKATGNKSGIPVVRMGNIQEGELDFSNLKYFPKNYKELDKYLLYEGDTLFNRTNSTELVGKSALYKKHHPKSIFASYLIRVKVNKELYSPEFLNYYINSLLGRNYIRSVVSQQVGQANVNGTKLKNMPILLMPLEEQHQIVKEIEKRFSEADNLEKAINESLTKAEVLRQSILKQAFEGRLV